MARKLRLFLSFLAERTEVKRIHIVAYSAGSRLVAGALEQLALLHAGETSDATREKLRIGSVIYVGADMSREQFGVGLTDGMLEVAERTVVYMSSTDVALRWARRIFRRPRLGQMWDAPPPPRVAEFLRAHPSLELVDVTGSAGSTTGNGHSFFRQSPWVSSDLLALLAFGLDAKDRGLVPDNDLRVWRFPPDYIERLRSNIFKRYPDLTGRLGEPVGGSDDD